MNNSSSLANIKQKSTLGYILSIPVLVAALGYFVDIYDLVLFSIVRVPSLKSLGLDGAELLSSGLMLLDVQMGGMLIGGILWGILGDKKGRLKILFGSILMYSLANIANGFASSINEYMLWRFVAGLGLAGELGAGITLVLEVLPKNIRGYGTMVVASVGVSGAILANFVAQSFDWRAAFFIGGGLGFLLLILRISVYESGMFKKLQESKVKKGDFLSLFTEKKRFFKYAKSILIGLPQWFSVGVLVTCSPELSKALNIQGKIDGGDSIMFTYLGFALGDFASGFLSQYFKSRKKIVYLFISMLTIIVALYFTMDGASVEMFYAACFGLGFGGGYWAVFVTIAAEQFGTNLRATVASTAPNFIRGMVIPITILFHTLSGYVGILSGAAVTGAICLLIAFVALYYLEETYHKDLDYYEL